MAKFHKEVMIHSPVDKVFEYMLDPRNLPEIWPSMIEVKHVTRNHQGGYKFDWVYKMAGMHFDGGSDTTECIPNKRVVTESTKGIDSRFIWEYETVNEDTKLSVEIEYKIPIPLIGKIAEAVIVKQNEHEADILLANLKNRMEIETPVPA